MITNRPKSYFVCFEADRDRTVRESDVMCCQHCGRQQFIPKSGLHDVGDLCRHCWEFICPACVKLGTCDPLEQKFLECERNNTPFNPYRL